MESMDNLPVLHKGQQLAKVGNTAIGLISQILNEGDADFWYNKGLEHKRNKQWQASYYCLTKAIELDSSNSDYYFVRAYIVIKLSLQNEGEVVDLIISGFFHLSAQDSRRAFGYEELDDLILYAGEEISMEGNRNLFALSIIYYWCKNKECVQCFDKVTNGEKEFGAYYYLLQGLINTVSSRIEIDDFLSSANLNKLVRINMIKSYTRAIVIKPDLAVAYYFRGIEKTVISSLDGQTKYEDGTTDLDDYLAAAKLNPKYLDAYFNLLRIKNKRFFNSDKAREIQKGNTSILSNATIAYYMRVEVKRRYLRDHNNLIKDCNELAKLNPKDTYAYFESGRARYFLRDYQGCIDDLSKGIALYPNKDEIQPIISLRDMCYKDIEEHKYQ